MTMSPHYNQDERIKYTRKPIPNATEKPKIAKLSEEQMNTLMKVVFYVLLQLGSFWLGDYLYYLQYGHSIIQGEKTK